ncbi:MAG: hypothetical protein V3R56_09350 [Xanthomonadales bacterium]
MTGSQKVLLSGGLALAILGMAYGLWYAVADEHPTLERMGVSLASAFAEVAKGEMDQGREYLETYGETRFEYIREVHFHGHLVALSTLLLVLGLFFNQLAFSERIRLYLASALVFGTVALPLGSVLEILLSGAVPKAVALLGAVSLIGGLSAVAAGLALSAARSRED